MNHEDKHKQLDQLRKALVPRIENNAESIRSFGRQLATLIKKYCVRNTRLSELSGVSTVLIAQYRRGRASCSVERAHELANLMGCTKAERIALTRAAAFTTKDPIGESIHAILMERGIRRESIQSVAASVIGNELKIATHDGRAVKVKISIGKLI